MGCKTQGPWRAKFILGGVLSLVAWPLISIGFLAGGPAGLVTAAVAFLICLASGLFSLTLAQRFSGPEQIMHRVLWSALPRTAGPLLACMAAYGLGGLLAQSGFVYYVMSFYFVMLAAETVLLAGSQRQHDLEHCTEPQTS